ncbi:hypothetical protein CEXT_189271 [Caerostris extrusa]|uniref:Uncharacterized protein n=1 Tax=Caerostris extrusa TaxID=172846 RepID=A0AAV4MI78_CAEEX|nr:hypothetical protein CEXT_189271 [Caerostris extrusa]
MAQKLRSRISRVCWLLVKECVAERIAHPIMKQIEKPDSKRDKKRREGEKNKKKEQLFAKIRSKVKLNRALTWQLLNYSAAAAKGDLSDQRNSPSVFVLALSDIEGWSKGGGGVRKGRGRPKSPGLLAKCLAMFISNGKWLIDDFNDLRLKRDAQGIEKKEGGLSFFDLLLLNC